MEIHERLRFLRKELGMTTRTFGAAINKSCGSITNMEKGTRKITQRTAQDICRAYHVNPGWLLEGTEPMFEDVTKDLDISEEVLQLVRQYSQLTESDRKLVKMLIDSLAEKAGHRQ